MWCEQIDATRGHQYGLVIKLEFMRPSISMFQNITPVSPTKIASIKRQQIQSSL
jgi:hypothetical protein